MVRTETRTDTIYCNSFPSVSILHKCMRAANEKRRSYRNGWEITDHNF